jgi:hypothetical protein
MEGTRVTRLLASDASFACGSMVVADLLCAFLLRSAKKNRTRLERTYRAPPTKAPGVQVAQTADDPGRMAEVVCCVDLLFWRASRNRC